MTTDIKEITGYMKNWDLGEEDEYKTPTEPTQLNAEESLIFVEAITNPPPPTQALKALFAEDNDMLLLKAKLGEQLYNFVERYEEILEEQELSKAQLEDKLELAIKEFFWTVTLKF
jgi:hypothetical protein